MKKKIHIAASQLTGTIFAGTILKPGIWAEGKQDVTSEAINAVADHLIKNGGTVVLANESGQPEYEMTINKVRE
jgi:orotidine-5'-phosphate decarboxylase